MKTVRNILLAAVLLVLGAACETKPGPDAISSHAGGDGSGSGDYTNCTALCHQSGGAAGFDPLATNGSGTAGKHVAHVSSGGLACERCHYGYATNPNHMNGIIDGGATGISPVAFDLLNSPPSSSALFSYSSGPPAAGNCSNVRCHVDSAGTPTAMNWYGPDVPFILPNCSVCHSVAINGRRQVLGAAGDFASNPTITSHHVTGVTPTVDPSTSQCKMCHDQYRHMAGTVHLLHASTGTRVTYDRLSPASLEPFCLGCHNMSGATFTFASGGSPTNPFNDGSILGTMPYVASMTIASSWSGSSTHRSKGLTCAGTGAPNTGCHGSRGSINAHGSTVKGLLTSAMNFQIPLSSEAAYSVNKLVDWNYNNYKLCFDCHANYPAVTKEVILGYRSGGVYDLKKAPTPYYTLGMQSLFRDKYILGSPNNPLYNDGIFDYSYLPLHNYHLIGFETRNFVPPGVNALQWKYRGDSSRIGRITCTACHNVHGTAAPTMRNTHQELDLARDYYFVAFGFASLPGDSYTSLNPVITETMMTSYPMNCAISCHQATSGILTQSYWHTPNGD